MLNDLFGYFKRNYRKMSAYEKKKAYNELKGIVQMMEKDMIKREAI